MAWRMLGAFIFPSVHRFKCAEEEVHKRGCSGPWFLAWWASAQTRPRLRSRPDGGGLALAAAA